MNALSSRIGSIPTTPTLTQALAGIPLPREEDRAGYTSWTKDAGFGMHETDFNSYEQLVARMLAFRQMPVVLASDYADKQEATDFYVKLKLPNGTRAWVRVNFSGNTSASKLSKCYGWGVVPLQVNVGDLDDERLMPGDIARMLFKSIKRMVVDAGVNLTPVPADRAAKLDALLAANGHAA